MGLLRDYIAYARAHCRPQISDSAAQALIDRYLDMRRHGALRGQVPSFCFCQFVTAANKVMEH